MSRPRWAGHAEHRVASMLCARAALEATRRPPSPAPAGRVGVDAGLVSMMRAPEQLCASRCAQSQRGTWPWLRWRRGVASGDANQRSIPPGCGDSVAATARAAHSADADNPNGPQRGLDGIWRQLVAMCAAMGCSMLTLRCRRSSRASSRARGWASLPSRGERGPAGRPCHRDALAASMLLPPASLRAACASPPRCGHLGGKARAIWLPPSSGSPRG